MAADIKEVFSKDHDDLKPLEKTKKNDFACEIIFTNGGGRIRTAEKPKKGADLQSAAFGHFATPPVFTSMPTAGVEPANLLITIQSLYQLS